MNKKITIVFALLYAIICNSQQNYYSDVNLSLTGLTLKEALATKITSTHSQFLFYDQIWDASKVTDVNPNNNQEVLLVYGYENGSDSNVTNDRTRGIDNNGGSSGDWNREHVYSRSLGTPNLGEAGPGSDAHHLRPADAQRNSSRSNRKFTSGSGNSGIQQNGGWYPGDEWKGDVARMMMYMYLRYDNRCLPTNVGIGNSNSTPDDMIDLFLKWNAEDPVSNFEKQRNTFHGNTANQNAQGNRNPFIDNPILATRIWGGPEAEDIWGIFTNSDTEAPTTPTNILLSNITTFSVKISWNASTDNTAVTSYDVFIDGNLAVNTSGTSATIINLTSNTTYAFTVLAKDIAENTSALSTPVNGKTLEDTEAPSMPTNIIVSNETGESFKISWDTSTDNTAVTSYDVFIDNNFIASTPETTYTVAGLSNATTYKVQVWAKDAVGNTSQLSSAINAKTTDGSTTTANELFFSEYIEGSSNNKAIEIANLTSRNINLNDYSLKRQKDGGKDGDVWENELVLSGTIAKNDVFVIINGKSSIQKLIDEADFVQPNASETNFGAPVNFNGNDPVGLFKNDKLIDIIGTYNGGSSNFGKDKTLRRKSGVSQPNTAFDIDNEWDIFPKDTADDFGQHNVILSTQNNKKLAITIYPNPVSNMLRIHNTDNIQIDQISIINTLGKQIIQVQNPNKEINIQNLSKGIYILKFVMNKSTYSTKFVKK